MNFINYLPHGIILVCLFAIGYFGGLIFKEKDERRKDSEKFRAELNEKRQEYCRTIDSWREKYFDDTRKLSVHAKHIKTENDCLKLRLSEFEKTTGDTEIVRYMNEVYRVNSILTDDNANEAKTLHLSATKIYEEKGENNNG